jgi:3-hydroxyacyl-CoA dehydrogenase
MQSTSRPPSTALERRWCTCRGKAAASDIDIVYLYGYGFPAYRGGPMFWAENEVGLETALEKLKKYSAQTGGKWLQVSPLLERLVAEGKGFASLGS